MKNYFLMSILLVVACVCASCEPNSEKPINYQEGEVSQVELSIADNETLDQIFQHVESTKADDLLHEAGARCIPFIVRSKKDLQQLAPKGVQVPNLDFEKYSLVWCVYESPYLEAKVTSYRMFMQKDGVAQLNVDYKCTSFCAAFGENCHYALFNIPSDAIKFINVDLQDVD